MVSSHEPSIASFHRRTLANRLLTYAAATRPAFLSGTVLPVIVGGALARHLRGDIDWALLALAVVAIAFIHSGINLVNDYCDALNGSDAVNTERVFPFTGGSRFIQNGVLTAGEVRRLAVLLLAAGGMAGLVAVWLTGPLLLAIGLVGAGLAVIYSAPPCLVCRGLGDVAVVVAAGVLPVLGTMWMLTGAVEVSAAWVGAAVGCFAAAILWANSIPDIAADRLAGKLTLPARLGPRRAAWLLPVWFVAGFGLICLARVPVTALVALAAAIPGGLAWAALLGGRMATALPLTILTHAVFCGLLCVGLWVG